MCIPCSLVVSALIHLFFVCLSNQNDKPMSYQVENKWHSSYLPDALVQSSEFSHQLSGSFVLIAAQVVYSLYGLRSRLQLIFIDVDSLVLGLESKNIRSVVLKQNTVLRPFNLTGKIGSFTFNHISRVIFFISFVCTFFHVSTTLAA